MGERDVGGEGEWGELSGEGVRGEHDQREGQKVEREAGIEDKGSRI